MKQFLYLCLIAIILNSCALSPFHSFGHVPSKPGTYPRFTINDTIRNKLDDLRAGYDVSYYDIDIKVDPARESISGNVRMAFNALTDLKKMRLDLYDNMEVEAVMNGDQKLSFTRNDRAITVDLPFVLHEGNDCCLKIIYNGKPVVAKRPPWQGGLVWSHDRSDNPWFGVTCETEGASLWFPCKDHLSDEPDSVRIKVTVPEGLQVVSNGIMTGHSSSAGLESFVWETQYPENIYNITFYGGHFEYLSDTLMTSQGILKLGYYVLPENLDIAKSHFTQVKDVLNCYSELFGPYPWINEGFKLIESPYEGMEHQTAIAYGNRFKNSSILGGDYIIVHESAHEWWGNAVSVSDFSDIWLQEGFATYSECLFVEKKLGRARALEYISYMLAPFIYNKLPVVGPRDVGYWDFKDIDVYFKGAMILHSLRNIIANDSVFFDILRTFYSDHARGSHPDSHDFISLVEHKTGRSWKNFFDVYLNQRETPLLEWYYSNGKDEGMSIPQLKQGKPFIIARFSRVPEGFTMPVTFFCTDTKSTFKIEVTNELMLFYLPSEFDCTRILCNPDLTYFENSPTFKILSELENKWY